MFTCALYQSPRGAITLSNKYRKLVKSESMNRPVIIYAVDNRNMYVIADSSCHKVNRKLKLFLKVSFASLTDLSQHYITTIIMKMKHLFINNFI